VVVVLPDRVSAGHQELEPNHSQDTTIVSLRSVYCGSRSPQSLAATSLSWSQADFARVTGTIAGLSYTCLGLFMRMCTWRLAFGVLLPLHRPRTRLATHLQGNRKSGLVYTSCLDLI
jgi:hypothetical protein